MPKLPVAHALPAQTAIFFAAVPVLSAVLSLVRALARCGLQWFAWHAGFSLGALTGRCSGLLRNH